MAKYESSVPVWVEVVEYEYVGEERDWVETELVVREPAVRELDREENSSCVLARKVAVESVGFSLGSRNSVSDE